MKIAPLRLVAAFAALAAAAAAQDLSSLPPYRPAREVDGTIRSWGHGFLKTMMGYWEAGFRRHHPRARFEDNLASSAAAMAGLYCGQADLGILAREITPPETAAYAKVAQQKTFSVTVLTGSYGDPDKLMALGIFVARDNPVSRLTFSQLDAIFGAEPRRGEAAKIRTWGQFGAGGEWADRPIHPYAGPADEMPAFFFSQRVLGGGDLWNEDLRQYDDLVRPDGTTIDGYQRVLDAAAADRGGIALTGAGYRNPAMKLVPIAAEDAGPAVAATPETVFDGSYPLRRPVRFYLNNGPAVPADPDAVEFLRYVVSREGQEEVKREGVFIPLNAETARAEMAKLDRLESALADIPDSSGLRLVATLAVPAMRGTWDHLTADPNTGRLFLSAQDDQAVDVVDLGLNRPIRRVAGPFRRPQGECYLPDLDRWVVTNGRDGMCRIFDGLTYEPRAAIPLSLGADLIAYDRDARRLYVESGGTDSGRGPGRITVVDAVSERVVGEIATGLRAAAMVVERSSARLYVALPGADQIAVVDRSTRQIVARFDLPGRPASLALDDTGHRLFVATRTFAGDPRPARFVVLDTRTGRRVATLDSPDATEDMAYDAAHRRIYSSSLEGEVQVYRQLDPDHYAAVARIMAGPHAGTSCFIPELNRLCVAVPPRGDRPGQVWVFATVP